jgi:cytochrome c biogenesis protein CcmG/thiol:disulfide interchange protein DsbE
MRRLIGFVALLVIASACGGSDPSAALPDITLERVDGDVSVDLGDLDGPAVVNLWATWCAPCRREIPDLEAFHRDLGDAVDVIGINIGDEPDQITNFLKDLEEPTVTYTQLVDPLADVADHLGTSTLPVTVVVADGRIVERHDGPITADELNDLIAPHVG